MLALPCTSSASIPIAGAYGCPITDEGERCGPSATPPPTPCAAIIKTTYAPGKTFTTIHLKPGRIFQIDTQATGVRFQGTAHFADGSIDEVEDPIYGYSVWDMRSFDIYPEADTRVEVLDNTNCV
jgi:hypothetical protein